MHLIIIIALCYIAMEVVKRTPIRNEFLPILSAILGALLNLATHYLVNDADGNAILEALQGLMCGLSSTGGNQVVKQILKYIKALAQEQTETKE